MNRLINISFGTLFLLSSSIALACDYPERPSIPDGSAASKDELLVAKNSIQDFMAKVDEYLNCIEGEEKAAVEEMDNPSEEILQRRDEMLNKKFDAANEEKALLGEQFNQQIRAYNNKLQESKE
jgi:small-conductance mechanosensitive channel